MLAVGSTWRRWDLHIHTPDTILNNQFGTWEEFLAAIEAQTAVTVLGVTDYCSIANYSRLKRYKQEGRLPAIDLLIPNIEFRIAPPNEHTKAVNIHLLISPDDPAHEAQILAALNRLSWRYADRNYSCVPEQLIALGRAYDPHAIDDRTALRAGVTQFKVDFTTLRDWYDAEPWLRTNSLVAVAAGDDGLSGIQHDGAWGGYREEITRFSQMIFSGRPGERDFWLGRRHPDDLDTIRRLGGHKPCIHGSDAHDIEHLFRPHQERYCWIKADPTFEGLKQLLYEPEDRVYIGPSPPSRHDNSRLIRSVTLSHSDWFDEIEIPLNPDLISIIGNKGNGKSALAELIAYAAGSWPAAEPGTFLRRAGDHLQDLRVRLNWADGSLSDAAIGHDQPEPGRVRFLSQRFVERLCSDDHIGADLVAEIEAVVFAHLDPTDTLDASSFEQLRTLRTEGVRSEGQRLRDEMSRLTREECSLTENAATLQDKKERLKALHTERTGLTKQIPKPATEAEAKVQADLQAKRKALAEAQQATATDKQRLQTVSDIKTRIAAFKAQMATFTRDIHDMLDDAGVPADDRTAFHPAFPGDTDPPLARREVALDTAIRLRQGTTENPAEGTIRWLQNTIAELEKRESADKARQTRVNEIQSRIAQIDTATRRIQAEIAGIEGPEKERMVALRRDRLDAYAAYFANLRVEQNTLEDLYAPVSARLAHEDTAAQEQDLEFSIRWEADLNAWLQRGATLFDQRTAIPYGTIEGLAHAARTTLVPAWISGDPEQVRKAMEQDFLPGFWHSGLAPSKYLRSGINTQDVLEWLYEVNHVRLSYGLKYNGVELEKLSPGTKGIVLLILYIGMDHADTRPLIVDQPDENLDNESIYELLTTYFKTAKGRRQILLITHNPNLVVNTDSEQVIVATAETRENGLPHFTYQAGALEDDVRQQDTIRYHVCRILEGGSAAFRQREQRYALPDGHAPSPAGARQAEPVK